MLEGIGGTIMRNVTKEEFLAHVGQFGSNVEVRYMYAGRCADFEYKVMGSTVGEKHQLFRTKARKGIAQETYSISE
jgi:hypothetical protein